MRSRNPLDDSADVLADIEDAAADRYEEVFGGDDNSDAEFLRADAQERRRLEAINQEEARKEREELKAWAASIKMKKAKKKLEKD